MYADLPKSCEISTHFAAYNAHFIYESNSNDGAGSFLTYLVH